MAVSAKWDDADETIMRWTFEGACTWEEYYQARTSINQQIHAKKHTVDILVDLRTCTLLPGGVLMHARNAVLTAPNNIGLTAMVTINPVLRAFFNMFSNLYRGLIHSNHITMIMVATMEEAYAALDERRANKV